MKKTITIEKAQSLLEECYAVILNDCRVCFPVIHELSGDPNIVFLTLEIEDSKIIYHTFCEDVEDIQFEGITIFMKDDVGADMELTLLTKGITIK